MPQSQLDRVVRLAARSFDAAIALLSLREGDRLRVRSSVGLEPAESEGAASLCAQAARCDGPLVVADLLEDPRFARNPLVSGGPGIRFCAAAPLKSSGGLDLGVLCVLDSSPRAQPPPEQLRTLADIAALTADQIELRRQVDLAAESDELRFKLAAIVDSSDDAIISKRLDGTITSWNRGAEKLYGYRAEEVVGKHISLLVPTDRPDEVDDILAQIRRGEPVDHFETRRVPKDGVTVPVALTISPIKNAQGEISGASTIARDISERERLTAGRDAALDEAQVADRLKSEFLATMSHEIRTPMNGVIGMTGLLLDTELNPEQRDYAETIRSSGEALMTIINDILDFSKIEAGRLDLEIIDFDLRPVVEELVDLLAEPAQAKGLELVALISPDVPTHVSSDPGRLRQVLINLLGNAIKFTHQGEVVLRVGAAEAGDRDALLRFEIVDTGIGIAADKQDALFEPFSQADASTTRTYGGTGLGLAICKRIVALLGGEIGLRSRPGEGSTFWFTARMATPLEAAGAPLRALDDLRDLHVLIVDDNQTNRTILEHQVRCWGMRAGSAAAGADGLEMLRAAVAAGEPYDIAILDMEMPGMDGLKLAREIHADAALARTPLVLLTCYAVRGSAKLARQARIDGYLTKPVRQSQLYDCLATVMGSGTQAAGLVTRHVLNEAQARARPRLLVAEDNTINQKLIVAMLSKLGYRADIVANGIEAVDAVFTIGYGTVLMDCQMPEMDGFRAAAEIRKREEGARRTAIIAVTAGAMAGDRERCLAAGMDDYITKPIKLDELDAALRRWTGGHEGGPDVAREDTAATAAPLDAARLETLRSLQQEDQPDVLLTLMGPFLEEAPSQISMLRAAVARDDADALASVAHSLNGSATNLGAVGMGAICLELEAIVRSGELRSGDDAVARLELELDRVIAAFTAELKRPSAAG